MRDLRRLRDQPGNTALARGVAVGDQRAAQDMASDLLSHILTMGMRRRRTR